MLLGDCPTHKRCYVSQEHAEIALVEFRRGGNFREGTGPINVYQCEFCQQWHFTSKGTPSKVLDPEGNDSKITSSEIREWERKFRKY